MKTPDLFSPDGKKPRRPARKLMHVIEAGQSNSGKVIMFQCSHCGYYTDWMPDEKSVSSNKRGIPCPVCEKNLYQNGIIYGIDLAIAIFMKHGADGFVSAVEDFIEKDCLPEAPTPAKNQEQ